MTIVKTTNIERVVLAFRGDVDGAFKGAHVEYFDVIRDGDTEIARQPGKATTISEAAAAGFTWPDVAAGINAGALLTLDAQAAQIADLTTQAAAAQQSQADAETARDAALAQVQELQAQLLEYQTPVDENGVPKAVTMRQGQEEMLFTPTVNSSLTLLDWIDAAIDAIADPIAQRAALITWTKSSMIERANPLVLQLRPVVQQALGLADLTATDAAIDQMFINAAAR